MRRRQFLRRTGAATLGLSAMPSLLAAAVDSSRPRILLRSSWQTVNIGDIAHTPGVLSILREHLPEAQVTLWPSYVDNGVDELLLREFPELKIAKAGTPALAKAFAECDFLLHGSGASIVAERDLVRWHEETGKPFGIYGITFPRTTSWSTVPLSDEALARGVEVLNQASFVYFRDSQSLALARELGANPPVMEFGPDGAFACDLRDDEKAESFLAANGLKEGQFLCCIPRLRYTPFWEIKEGVKFDPKRHAINEAKKEQDHAPLRQAIIQLVEETNLKVLVCPEDRSQMAVGKEMIMDKLPSSVLDRVVWRSDYWLTGEAISVYVRSLGLFGNEMHSPIMCIGHDVPAIVCRSDEQTSKGLMWRDIGLGDWLFDLDSKEDRDHIAPTVMSIVRDREMAIQKARTARHFVEQRQAETMTVLRAELGA